MTEQNYTIVTKPGASGAGLLSYGLSLAPTDMPKLGAHDVLIKVAVAGVNRADLLQAQGLYPAPEGASEVLGLEVAGTIIAMGDEVRSLAVGNEVMALLSGGGYAAYVAAAEWRVLPKPQNLSLIEAAAVPEVFATVYQTLFEKARLKPGEWLLVHGGSSGIGMAAIQLAKSYGVRVAVTAGAEAKCQACKEWGADIAINYREQDFVDVLKKQNLKMNVVLDMVGGDYVPRNMKVLGKKGRLVQIALLQGSKAEVNIASLLMKNITWIGSTLRSEEEETIYRLMESLRTMVVPLLEEGRMKVIIDKTFLLAEAEAAHAYVQQGEHKGKVVLIA